jgi:hypothetical protein
VQREPPAREIHSQDTQVRDSVANLSNSDGQFEFGRSRLQLSQAKILDMSRRPASLRRNSTAQAPEVEIVDCQCGWNEEGEDEGDLVGIILLSSSKIANSDGIGGMRVLQDVAASAMLWLQRFSGYAPTRSPRMLQMSASRDRGSSSERSSAFDIASKGCQCHSKRRV